MTDPESSIGALADELAQLRARVEAQDAELAGLRSEQPVARRHLLRGLAGLGAAGVVGVAAAQPAAAADGDNLILGQSNTANTTTRIDHTEDTQHAALMVTSTDRAAVYATTVANPSSFPVTGRPTAVVARADGDDSAVWASARNGFSLWAENDSTGHPASVGASWGTAPGLGGVSYGHGPQLWLGVEDGAVAGPPPGYAETGYIRLDAVGDIWVCTEGWVDGGNPNGPFSWTRLLREDTAPGRTIPITPIRALDSRATGGRPAGAPAVPGQKKGPLKGGTGVTLDLAGVGPIPAAAAGVVGNLTVVAPSYSGHLSARPSGTTGTTSSLNFTTGATIANAFTSKLGPAGLTVTASGTSTQHYELIVDITAYIT